MIPQILELKNFLSYGQEIQRIDFRDYSLICLSGKNGHGKSALLDAITWTLWGQARKITGSAKADDGLLRLGQTGMMVSLEFLFSERTYRVRREYAKPYGKPYAALDFEVFDQENSRFISLTDKTIRTTQAKIDNLIGLDYETFINSAFIRQGQSNEFSKKSAKERKYILANILGLSKYDLLQSQALEKVKGLNDTKRGLIVLQEQFLKDLSRQEELSTKLALDKDHLITINKQLQTLHKTIKDQEKSLVHCVNAKNALSELQIDLTMQETRYHQGVQALQTRIHEWKKVHYFLLSGPNLEVLIEEKKLLKSQETYFLEIQQKNILLHEKILHAKDAYQNRFTILKNESDHLINSQKLTVQKLDLAYQHHQTITTLKTQQHKDVLKKIVDTQQEKASLEKLALQHHLFKQQFALIKTQFEKRRAFYQTLVQRGNWIKNELAELEHKQKTIGDNNNPACPLCQQLLTIKRKQFLAQQLGDNENLLRRRLQRIGTIIKKLKELLVTQHEEVQKLTGQAERYQQDELMLGQISKKLHDWEKDLIIISKEQDATTGQEKLLVQSLIDAQKQLETLTNAHEDIFQADEQLRTIITLSTELDQEKISLAFDPETYRTLQEKINAVDLLIHQFNAIKQASILQHERKQSIETQCKELKQLKMIRATHIRQLDGYSTIVAQEEQLLAAIAQNNQNAMVLAQQKEQILHAIGSLEYECNRLNTIKQELQKKMALAKQLDAEIEDYQIIATALSKNGIQALLIEEAIPEIEQEANTILARLTNNQSQIFIESLRDLKSGGVRETLDIQIADNAGIRPYEMYSGGEAFRVDFALRIAIAKLLARRAGTALQTLIIDEGFGSQDEEGLGHIMDCLHRIQDDFSKIIIVSHLPDFKHNFPVHFIIEKNSTGSTIRIEERG